MQQVTCVIIAATSRRFDEIIGKAGPSAGSPPEKLPPIRRKGLLPRECCKIPTLQVRRSLEMLARIERICALQGCPFA
jgi:hypothetical protein